MAEGGAKLDDFHFDTGESGASLTIPMEAGQIRKGGHIVIKGKPCKVVNVSTSKTGKHGHAKANFTAIDIFTGKKYEDIVPTTHTTSVPNVSRAEYQLIDISDDGYLSLLTDSGDTKDDLVLPTHPEGFADEIRAAFDEGKSMVLTVLSAMGTDQVVSMKEDTS
uniref:Eukaryotic translation initiation factor 5A n=1 Tax=Fibrocapsa japonica TaxID=94617 RepID=A0A7S2UU65_9STRA|mmetsp:Transcript_13657/g.20079  ORF Transcript_13657/g.20079 Transcript_13657/m.20079 type:complete len:164 (+) Transcript_13657:113-604(+)|eukprot:CAMPEP_0113934952 /NCGR_PEP_ID=MMETSP1339-20121228/2195_1 /TAXON_ID=94617 /ORGANISM="Fibrocapsa japonica" /LENGTH=163 /DNA_ID=CAMNT_0000936935 /DNA_START=124 /DNA_END=615 /DNA_ORIENTATION=- /assembly_acc=CAM_ASM_000762